MEKASKKQPTTLKILFYTEIWDRFSYYGIQAVLVLFLTKYFQFNDHQAYTFYGIYTTLAFSLPILGGYVADKFLGYDKAIIIGLIIAIIGNILLARHTTEFSYFGITLFIVGIGLFKANNASLLSHSYSKNDPMRESGFVLFYMAMNIGAILGPLSFGLLSSNLHWAGSFYTNAFGLSSALAVFLLKYKPLTSNITKHKTSLKKYFYFFSSLILFIALATLLFKHHQFFSWIMLPITISILIFLFFIAHRKNPIQKFKLYSLIILIIFALFFFACSLQVGSSITLFIDRFIDRKLFGYTVPTASFSSLEPLFVIITSLVFVPILNKYNKVTSPKFLIYRIFLGVLLASLSFFCFCLVAYFCHNNLANYILIGGIAFGNLLLGLGELCIGPALIAAVSYLAPQKKQGTFMGFWYFSIAFSGYLASLMAKLNTTTHPITAFTFSHNFFIVGLFTLGVSLLFLITTPLLYRWMSAH
jgi:POT family proton-dependent oligopeptide transporter